MSLCRHCCILEPGPAGGSRGCRAVFDLGRGAGGWRDRRAGGADWPGSGAGWGAEGRPRGGWASSARLRFLFLAGAPGGESRGGVGRAGSGGRGVGTPAWLLAVCPGLAQPRSVGPGPDRPCCPPGASRAAGGVPPLAGPLLPGFRQEPLLRFRFPAGTGSRGGLEVRGCQRERTELREFQRKVMELRGYQWEAVGPALRGLNSIIWLPTGAGKTRAAAFVCRQHLESRRGRRVAVLVNKAHLVEQHAQKEFQALQKDFRVIAISGDSDRRWFFASLAKQSDIVICTAQILQNALGSKEEDTCLELTDFSLLVIDECHHTHKEAVYNKIMLNYLQRKLCGQQDLPQVLGLTASPGTGGATSFEEAVQHILQICANLDTEKITSVQKELQELQSHIPQPRKQHDLCQERAEDPFGEQLKKVMERIQQYMEMPGLLHDFGTQNYEQHIVELETRAAETFCRRTRVCALHLRKYNDALLIHDTVRMVDAFQCLQQFYETERDMKDPTEQFLAAMFEENRKILQALSRDQRYENPRLCKLEEILQENFQPLGTSRGIVFTKTRQSAHSLLSWLQDTATLRGQHIRAAVLTGAGYSNQTRHMTQNEQQEVIRQFREGTLNLLFSTSVAEEGLDIPECNIVVRYGLMTNEIAMMQARGRARAQNSVYSVLAKANSREVSRELLNENLVELMEKAIRAVQAMPEAEYRLKITELQRVAVASWLMKEAKISERQRLHDPDTVLFHCVGCNVAVCRGSDIRTVEGTHHININPSFRLYYKVSSGKMQFPRVFKDWEPGCRIACRECSQDWGMEMIYQQVKLPILCIKNFVVETPAEKRKYKKWSTVTFPVGEFDYLEYCCSTQDLSL